MYKAEIASVEQKIIVVVISPDSATIFRRSFHTICDAERWLSRLARAGIRKRDCAYLLKKDTLPFELPPLRAIRVCDKRQSKRFELPEIFT
jgi:hypothetical protein